MSVVSAICFAVAKALIMLATSCVGASCRILLAGPVHLGLKP
ncbi:MAG: hypothetical protein V3R64_07600 [Sphingomonadales bacterium]